MQEREQAETWRGECDELWEHIISLTAISSMVIATLSTGKLPTRLYPKSERCTICGRWEGGKRMGRNVHSYEDTTRVVSV